MANDSENLALNSTTVASQRNDSESILHVERWTTSLLLFCAFLLRCLYIFRFRYDSDEPQHLHTTWGWTQGLLQYRDFFDNHTPLFHMLFSPLVAALGERADILTYMRFAMVPLWFVALWAVWRIGSRIFSPRAGLWATVFLALLPWWFFCALEYRTDNLWAPLWLCALAVFVTEKLTLKRAFAGGFLLGICCCTSMKTSLLLAVSAMAFRSGGARAFAQNCGADPCRVYHRPRRRVRLLCGAGMLGKILLLHTNT